CGEALGPARVHPRGPRWLLVGDLEGLSEAAGPTRALQSYTPCTMPRRLQRSGNGGTSWDDILTSGHRTLRVVRTLFRHLPADPRCRLCIAPFGGFGGKVAGRIGFRPSRMNPNFCANC